MAPRRLRNSGFRRLVHYGTRNLSPEQLVRRRAGLKQWHSRGLWVSWVAVYRHRTGSHHSLQWQNQGRPRFKPPDVPRTCGIRTKTMKSEGGGVTNCRRFTELKGAATAFQTDRE